jgi:ABC-type branched-subunit amino acid transport system substrate-binding protein
VAPVVPSFAPAGRTVAALLVPLSGPAAPVGEALFNAAQLAVFEVADDRFTLLPFDTKGTAEGAAAAAEQAVAQHADIILGPLFSAEAKAAAPVVRQAGLAIVSFTADATAAGGGVYVLGFLPGPQAEQVADYAHSQNRERLAILAPANDYGRTVAEYLANNAGRAGVTVTGLEYYDPAAGDFASAIRRLIKRERPGTADVGFDGLLLPDEGLRLRLVGAALATQGIDPQQVKFLGTMLWEDSKAGSEPALVGGWYAAPPETGFTDFAARYAKVFGAKPPRLASLGYDATALAAVLGRGGQYSAARLTIPTGFAGVDGIFRLRPDGTSDRGYAIWEVSGDGPDRQIAPAPVSFQPIF